MSMLLNTDPMSLAVAKGTVSYTGAPGSILDRIKPERVQCGGFDLSAI